MSTFCCSTPRRVAILLPARILVTCIQVRARQTLPDLVPLSSVRSPHLRFVDLQKSDLPPCALPRSSWIVSRSSAFEATRPAAKPVTVQAGLDTFSTLRLYISILTPEMYPPAHTASQKPHALIERESGTYVAGLAGHSGA